MNNKKTINMVSKATSVKGQGVGSAYLEQVKLVREGLAEKFEVYENARMAADITHYHTINPEFFAMKGLRCRKGTSVCYVHMVPETVDQSLNLPKPARKAFYSYMIRFYKSMEHLVVVNPFFKDALESYGVPRERVTYIPNFVDTEQFHPISGEKKLKVRKKLGIPEGRFTVLCAGQLQVRKGAFDFLKCARMLPDVEFVWAGGFSFGRLTDGYDELAKVVRNPPPNVKFIGIVDREDMNKVYNAADVMALLSYDELFPMTILEAMCVNIPILLRDLPIYDDILFDFYYREKSVEGFVNEIKKLRGDSAYYAAGAANSRRGNEFYEKKHVLSMWDEFYSSILK
ncbi:MAG: glycosyltransferase family 4 protein [Lachnospiraceae bacterium]|nr:glycosyltransferase family 4 protein [Ruminococcus sp.]MCM1274829.1 glycosyltransferase family 4 protein [Lachnospiraceae bacterium]